MDRVKKTANLIIDINKYRRQQLKDFELIKAVCTYFDTIKSEKLSQADLRFLRYVANLTGIPHFYDVLEKFGNVVELEEYDLSTIAALIAESSLHTSTDLKVHRFQRKILDSFEIGKLNRAFLSASTSFGKTHLVFEIVKKMQYSNLVLIFPTIALLSENLERIISDPLYSYFKNFYKIHTLSEVEELAENNLFIYTPERFLSFMDNNENRIQFHFAFIDEVYKIDNDYLIDEELKEHERDVAYRLAVFYSLKPSVDVLLAGPYIDFSQRSLPNYNASFDKFLSGNSIDLLDFNQYEIVNKRYSDIKTAKSYPIDENLKFDFDNTSKTVRLISAVKDIIQIDENTIIYCSTRSGVETYAKTLVNGAIIPQFEYTAYLSFAEHIAKNFGEDWVVYKALVNGIGIHHGLVPKYIQKEIINLFNKGYLKVLISTTTITEGVNTSAKNLIVLHSKKGDKDLKKFDAKNIAGRAGRFLHHFSGRVIVLQNKFMDAINSEPEPIKHKNYDIASPKDEIDIYYTPDEFLQVEHTLKKQNIKSEQDARGIPDDVLNSYKVVSRSEKILIYDRISVLSESQFAVITALIRRLNYSLDIDNDGFQVVMNVLTPIIKNQKLLNLIERKDRNDRYSILTHFVHFYLIGGFIGSMQYKLDFQGKSKDEAIKETAEFVYSTLKYQVVKYLGVFNIMYKFHQSQKRNIDMNDVAGIDRLLMKLEYNALTEQGRIASDYGVHGTIVNYYEQDRKVNFEFDSYEQTIFNKIDSIIKGNN